MTRAKNSGYSQTDGHLGPNFLKGRLGDQINAVMSAVGCNFRLILTSLTTLSRLILMAAVLEAFAAEQAINPAS